MHIKNIVHFVTEQVTPSLLVSKNNEMMKKNEMLDQNLHKNPSYNTFVLTIEQNVIKTDIKVEVLHVTTLITKLIHKIDIVLHSEIDSVTTKVLLLHITLITI